MKQWYLFYSGQSEKLKLLVSEIETRYNYSGKLQQICSNSDDYEKLKRAVSVFPLPFAFVSWSHHLCAVNIKSIKFSRSPT